MKKLNIALVSHDGRKQEMLEWVKYNKDVLLKHNLYATGTTGRLIQEIEEWHMKSTGEEISKPDDHALSMVANIDHVCDIRYPFRGKVTCLKSGPLGGDAQISAMIAEGKIDVLIFFCDTLIMQGHNADIQGLSRIADTYNIAFAANRTSADMIVTSPLFGSDDYERKLPKCIEEYANRKL